MLATLPPENLSSSCSSSPVDHEECIEEMVDPSEMNVDESFVSPEAEFGAINQSLELIGVSPFNKRNMKRSAIYVPRKKERVKETILTKIDALATNSSTPQAQNELGSQDAENIVQSLVKKYESTTKRSEKISILTIFAPSWSRRKMMLRFGCSNRMATQAKHLALEKGILSNPNPKSGKPIEEDTADAVREFYHHDNISRAMPKKKDCLSVCIRGETVKLQKRLILGTLKEIYAQLSRSIQKRK